MVLYLVVVHVFAFRVSKQRLLLFETSAPGVTKLTVLWFRPDWNQPWCANLANLCKVTSSWGARDRTLPWARTPIPCLVWDWVEWSIATLLQLHTPGEFDYKAVTSRYKCLQSPEPTDLSCTEIFQARILLRVTCQMTDCLTQHLMPTIRDDLKRSKTVL